MNPKRKHEFKPGETLLFNESGFYCLVRCINNDSDAEWTRYTLEILEILAAPLHVADVLKVGSVFKVAERTETPYAGWYVRDPEEWSDLISNLRTKRDQHT